MLAFTNTPSPHHSSTTYSSYSSYTSTMDPFDAAELPPADSVPPPYELSQVDYETKISDTLQQSLRIAHHSRPSSSASRAPSSYEVWDQDAFDGAQAGGRQSRGAGSEAGGLDMQRRRMSSNTAVNMSAAQKERPGWLGEDGQAMNGRRSAPGGPIANGRSSTDIGQRPSRAMAATTSPIEEVSRNRLIRRYDEEAGIDNPPPPFAAARNDGLGALSGSSGPPSAYRSRHSASQSGPPLSPSSSSSSSSRTVYLGSDAPQSAPSMQSRHSMPPLPSHSRQRRDRDLSDPQSNSESPRLNFDPAVAYQSNYAYSGKPAAANASAFYSSAISSILNPAGAAPLLAPRSYLTVNSQPNVSTFSTPQRQAVPQQSSQPLNGALHTSPTSYQPQLPAQQYVRRPTVETYASSQPQSSNGSRRVSMPPSPAQQLPRNSVPPAPASQVQPNPPPRQSMEYYQPSQTTSQTPSSWSQSIMSPASSRGPPSVSSASVSSRPLSRQSANQNSTSISFVTPQRTQPSTIVYKPADGGNVPWMPPGAARPQNVYERRF
ncbi:hypothetical protein FRB96_006313 [Tulasnella sp. 330]|nr:hypothetical protein FRB96_006313 [Tulasnella sp. 330]KAG8885077.1 hypothetical protein FRB97_002242 [Tulasnella sp. 331]KAG8890634.1 hypothetical protein FRB98_007189 [Tulasnella sp. 332]